VLLAVFLEVFRILEIVAVAEVVVAMPHDNFDNIVAVLDRVLGHIVLDDLHDVALVLETLVDVFHDLLLQTQVGLVIGGVVDHDGLLILVGAFPVPQIQIVGAVDYLLCLFLDLVLVLGIDHDGTVLLDDSGYFH
jgi:hypothetical protein